MSGVFGEKLELEANDEDEHEEFGRPIGILVLVLGSQEVVAGEINLV